jgi:hypothetical protein
MTTALNFPQFRFGKPELNTLYSQGKIGPSRYMALAGNGFRTDPSQQADLAQRLMSSVQPFSGAMAANRNAANMMPMQQPQQQMAQSMAQGQGPSFQFEDLNRAFQLDPRNTLASALMQQGARGTPIRTPLEGIGRLSQSLVGAMLQKKALDRLEGQETTRSANLANALNTQLAQLPDDSPIKPIIQNIQSSSGSQEALNALAQIQTTNLTVTPPPIFKDVLDVNGNIVGQAGFNADDQQVTSIEYAPEPKLSALGQQAIDAGFEQGTEEFKNFILENAKKRGQNITISTGVGSEKGYAATNTMDQTFFKVAAQAQNTQDKVQLMIDFLNDGTVQPGFMSGNLNTINKIGQFFDPNFKVEGVAGTDAFEAFTNQIILPLVQELGRNPTDLDLQFVVAAQPNLSKSAAGNLFLLEVLKLKQTRDIATANFVNNFILQEVGKQTDFAKIPLLTRNALLNFYKTDPLFTDSYNQLTQKFKNITGQDVPQPNQNDTLQQQGLITP